MFSITQDQIDRQNRHNTVKNEVEAHLVRLLSPWQGKKVWKLSGYGGLVAKLEKEFNAYCDSHGYNDRDGGPDRVWLFMSVPVSSLTVTVKLLNAPSIGDNDIRLARVDDDGVLGEFYQPCKRRTDYDLTTVTETIAQARELEKQAQELRSGIYPFGRG